MKINIDDSISDKPLRALLNLFDRLDAKVIQEIELKELLNLICTQILLLNTFDSHQYKIQIMEELKIGLMPLKYYIDKCNHHEKAIRSLSKEVFTEED